MSKGLIKYADGFKGVCDYLESIGHPLADSNVIRQYDESYGKSYSGHCSEIVADLIISDSDFDSLKEKYGIVSDSFFGHVYYVIPE